MFAKVGQRLLNVEQIASMEIIEGDEMEVRIAVALPGAQPGDYLTLKGVQAQALLRAISVEPVGVAARQVGFGYDLEV